MKRQGESSYKKLGFVLFVGWLLPTQAVKNEQVNRSNLGPFKGTGREKMYAKAEACKLAMDAIEEAGQYRFNLVQSDKNQKPRAISRKPLSPRKVSNEVLKDLEGKKTGHTVRRRNRTQNGF